MRKIDRRGRRLFNTSLTGAAFLLSILLGLGGCGTGASSRYEEPLAALVGGTSADLSRLNGSRVYSVLSAQPVRKPESNDPPSAVYPFTLSTTGARAASNRSTAIPGREAGIISRQAEFDLMMRRAENELLASGTRQLSGRPADPDRAAPKPIGIDTPWNDVCVYNTGGQLVKINTTCRYISDHAYFFVDNRNIIAMEPYLADYGAAFDQIYQINHAKFGKENDIDGNGKVIIVFTQELTDDLLGYFYAIDKFPQTVFEDSNEGDIFYMTTNPVYQGGIVKATLAHEFQHMIYFDEHYNRGADAIYTWLNEALSQAAEYYSGYLENHHAWIASFLYGSLEEGSPPNWAWGLSLTHWTSANYGYGAVFIRYLIDQYGDLAIKNMCATEKAGVAAVEAATRKDFNLLFVEFSRALVMSGAVPPAKLYPRYRFITLDLRTVQPAGRGGLTTPYAYEAGETIEGTLVPYEIRFFQWSGAFGNMSLFGDSMIGTAFGLER